MADAKRHLYEENPELLVAEKAAMENITKDDYKEFGFLKDGRAYWSIGFESRLSGRRYRVVLLYPANHPSKIEIPGIRVYPIEPSYESMVEEMNESSRRKDTSIPYSIRDCNGNYLLSVCVPEWCHRDNTLELRQGIISAATVFLETKRLIVFYEKGVANHGKGFCDHSSVDSEEEKQACIEYFGDTAVEYYRENSNRESEEKG